MSANTRRPIYTPRTQDPHFATDRPPGSWIHQHVAAERATIFARHAELPTIMRNRPVPRLASHHYFSVDRDRRNIYFY